VPPRLSDSGTVAAELERARLRCRAIAPPAELRGLSLRDAYDIQDAVVACRERTGSVRTGWKLGLTSRVKQHLMGIDHPLFGRLFRFGDDFDADVTASRGRMDFASFIGPRVEPELAFGLSAPLDPHADMRSQLGAVAWFAPALEITDSRYLPGKRSAVELVADNTSAAAYVIAERVPLGAGPGRLDAIGAQLARNGDVVAFGTTADVLGDPLTALALLAQHLADRGLFTNAGDIVLSGAITDAVAVAPGDRFEARLDGFGSAAVAFV
jgi:2-keto-4-pentenoate hydratase